MRVDPNRWWCTFDKQIFNIKEIIMTDFDISDLTDNEIDDYWTQLTKECVHDVNAEEEASGLSVGEVLRRELGIEFD